MKRIGLLLLAVLVAATLAAPAMANTAPPGSGGSGVPAGGSGSGDPLATAGGPVCIAVPVLAGLAGGQQGSCKPGEREIPNDEASGGAIVFYLKMILRLVNGLVAGIIVLMIIIAGIRYLTSAGDPTNVKGAKKTLMNAFIALFLYLGMFAILNFLVPGGLL